MQDVDAIAVTCGPGLTGALLVGVAAAKALALAHDKPLYGVNHLVAHVAVDQLEHGRLEERVGALLVSGGHTEVLLVDDIAQDVTMLGSTIDDAAGEAFDKVARLLGLPYPGGPHIDREARGGDTTAVDFPRGLTRPRDLEKHRFDFSFSGLKSAVARHVQHAERMGRPVDVADVAASFQDAVCDVLTRKAVEACQEHDVDTLVVGGGVAANGRLRELIEERAAAAGITVRMPAAGPVHRQRRDGRRAGCRGRPARPAAVVARPASRLEHAGHAGRGRLARGSRPGAPRRRRCSTTRC